MSPTGKFNAYENGYVTSEELELEYASAGEHIAANKAYVESLKRVLGNIDLDVANISEGRVMELSHRHAAKTLQRHWEYDGLMSDRCVPVIVEGDEIRQTFDDTLSNFKPKVIYTVLAPEGVDYQKAITGSTISNVKVKTLPVGQMPELPNAPYILDIHKDLCPTYLRQEQNIANPNTAKFDQGADHQRNVVIHKDDKLTVESAASMSTVKPIDSLAQKSGLYIPEMNRAHVLNISAARNAYPRQEDIQNSYTQYNLQQKLK